jgi:hypothetical protein
MNKQNSTDTKIIFNFVSKISVSGWWYALAQLVDALRYKPESGGFDSRWCHCNLPLT